MGMVPVTPHCTPSVFSVGLLRLRASGTLSYGHCYPTLHTFMITGLIWVCVASLSGRTPQPQIITALRTVLFISHPFGVIYVQLKSEN